MGSVVLIFMLFAVMIFITVLLLFGWVVVSILRLVFRGFGMMLGVGGSQPRQLGHVRQAMRPPMLLQFQMVLCANRQCRNPSPGGARFCRRCGQSLPRPQS